MRQILIIGLMSFLVITGCASNPIVNGKNVGGLVGASGGAYGGSVLCKGCSGGAQIASVAGGALLGWLAGSYVGEEFWDKKMQARQVKLIEDVLENNRDNTASTDTYTKSNWKNPNTGKEEPVQVSQTAVPLRTYKKQVPDIAPLNNQYGNFGIPPKYNMNNTRMASTDCRDIRIDFEVKGITPEPQKTQFYSFCRNESGWRAVK